MRRVRRIYQRVCSNDAGARTDEHKAMLEALAMKDPAAARTAMREHFHLMFEALTYVSKTEALAVVERKMREDRERFPVTTRV